jgi:toxin YoeB
MSYKIRFTQQAENDMLFLKKSKIRAYNKLLKLLDELVEHPYWGTGKPERMRRDYSDCYSRRITSKHRLIYKVFTDLIEVMVISAAGHYDDK